MSIFPTDDDMSRLLISNRSGFCKIFELTEFQGFTIHKKLHS